jgi:hypothetical protein
VKDWEKFFDYHKGDYIAIQGDSFQSTLTIETIYQYFKKRMIDELLVDIHGTSNYGKLKELNENPIKP